MTAKREDILEALESVMSRDGVTPLPRAGIMSDILVQGGKATFSLAVDPDDAGAWEAVRKAAETVVASLPGISAAIVTLTAERREAASRGSASKAATFPSLAQVRRIVAVASGKGGVGKSTTAANLALGFKALGLSVGVLDADIYGPSMPKLFALKGSPRITSGRTLEPLEAYGCKVMSIGFVVDPGKAMVWRGPMVASAVTQMLRDVVWGVLDIMVVDMPPGTGDAQLTLSQAVPLAGAVIVSTPQDLALIDARRGVQMFREVGVPVLGLIENMSYFVCDACGKRHHLFAHGGARAEAAKQNVPFLGEIALDPEIRERSDAGLPLVVANPDGEPAKAYRAIAAAIWTRLGGEAT